MLKYTDILVTFTEIPDEITLCINISNCPYHCPECHSKELWQDIGQRLTAGTLVDLMTTNDGVTCICFMGGDSDLDELYNLFKFIPLLFKRVKIAWYTGREDIPEDLPPIDYIKIGPYKAECGPLNDPNTNQRFYARGLHLNKMDANPYMWYDITDRFWKNAES